MDLIIAELFFSHFECQGHEPIHHKIEKTSNKNRQGTELPGRGVLGDPKQLCHPNRLCQGSVLYKSDNLISHGW